MTVPLIGVTTYAISGDWAEQLRLARLASEYLVRHRLPECACRFDVVSIHFDDIDGSDDRAPDIQVIQNAFDA